MTTQNLLNRNYSTAKIQKKQVVKINGEKRYFPSSFKASWSISSKRVMELSILYLLADS